MRICIFGMGAIGGHYAAKLAAAGHQVSVVARGANLERIRHADITLRSGEEVFSGRVIGSDKPSDLGAQDVVISTLKANSLPALAIGATFRRMAVEAKAIAAAIGVDLSDTFDAETVIKNAPDHTPSIRQDYDLGRPMELESMLLVPMEFARATGLATPYLDTVTALAVLQARDKGLYTP